MSTVRPTTDGVALDGRPLARDDSRELLGQVMAFIAVTVGFAALGAYMRDLSAGAGLLFFLGAFGAIIGLNVAVTRVAQQLAIALLFGLGLLLGLAVAPVVAEYAKADPAALWQAAGATAAFVAGCGAYGYATRRDLSAWTRALFWALLALIGFGLVAIFVSIPGANVIYPVAGLVIFGGFTIVEFNRLRRSSDDTTGGAVPIAAGIFLDIFNVFLLFFDLFGGGGSDN
jgi:modulator of FtsH protease